MRPVEAPPSPSSSFATQVFICRRDVPKHAALKRRSRDFFDQPPAVGLVHAGLDEHAFANCVDRIEHVLVPARFQYIDWPLVIKQTALSE